jgi:hypothetical protein
LKNQNSASKIIIQDLSGKVMLTHQIDNNPEIDLTNLSNGMYLLTVYSNDKVVAIDRVIKE